MSDQGKRQKAGEYTGKDGKRYGWDHKPDCAHLVPRSLRGLE